MALYTLSLHTTVVLTAHYIEISGWGQGDLHNIMGVIHFPQM